MDIMRENLQLLLSGFTALAMIFGAYKLFTDPDIKAKNRLDVMENSCEIKHNNIDKSIVDIEGDIKLIKENHLFHIERDMSDLKGDVKSILAILKIKDK